VLRHRAGVAHELPRSTASGNAAAMHVRGVDLAIERYGPAPSGTGTGNTMLWCHGLSSSMANEDERGLWHLAGPASDAGFELIRYDARGHGRSAGTPVAADYTWANLSLDALELHDAIAVADADPWVVGGSSMGAATTLHLAVQRPKIVRAMVLMIPPTAWETRMAQRELYENAAGYIRAKGKDAYVAASQRLPTIAIFADHPEVPRTAPDITEPLLPIVFEGAAASDFPSTESIRALTMPTLVLTWDTDPGHPVSTADRLAELLPHADVRIARDLDAIRTWSTTIGRFLRTV
jgi:3-oxoadipate enol-lactonase